MCEPYNGWANRETWALVLWIDNDQGLYEDVLNSLRGIKDDLPEGAELTDYLAGETVQSWTEALFDPDTYDGSLSKDLVTMLLDIGSLYRVDWESVGRHYVETLAEEN